MSDSSNALFMAKALVRLPADQMEIFEQAFEDGLRTNISHYRSNENLRVQVTTSEFWNRPVNRDREDPRTGSELYLRWFRQFAVDFEELNFTNEAETAAKEKLFVRIMNIKMKEAKASGSSKREREAEALKAKLRAEAQWHNLSRRETFLLTLVHQCFTPNSVVYQYTNGGRSSTLLQENAETEQTQNGLDESFSEDIQQFGPLPDLNNTQVLEDPNVANGALTDLYVPQPSSDDVQVMDIEGDLGLYPEQLDVQVMDIEGDLGLYPEQLDA